MKRILVIGIGCGGADLMTVQAIEALRAVDVLFIFDKGSEARDLTDMRKEICTRYCTSKPLRVVEIASPARNARDEYKASVAAWHAERAARAAAAMRAALADAETGAFLVWGDPAFYDSTLRVLDTVKASGDVAFDYEVIPGISSLQLLAARHRIALNAIGEPLLVTTGRKLTEGLQSGYGSIAVFLDNGEGLRSLAGKDARIHWGAYLGTPDEVLV